MDRWRGSVLLLLAVLSLLVIPRALAPGVAGTAHRGTVPEPPALGSCVIAASFHVVDCNIAHDAEVVASWAADDPSRPVGAAADYCGGFLSSLARPAGDGFFGLLSVAAVTTVRTGPSTVPAAASWVACVVSPAISAFYVGSLAATADISDRPSAFGECYTAEDDNFNTAQLVGCRQPHTIEVFGRGSGFAPDDPQAGVGPDVQLAPSDAALRVECEQIADTAMGLHDTTASDQLSIRIAYTRTSHNSRYVEGVEVPGVDLTGVCYGRAPAGRHLTDSVFGVGTNPLPMS